MPKISVSLPAESIKYLDSLGNNRSRALSLIVEAYRKRQAEEDLCAAYDAYAEFCKVDDANWFPAWESASASDLAGDL